MATIGLFSLNNIGLPEMLVVLAIGLLLFGKRLPDVGRSLGKGIVEFKRGLKGMADEIEEESSKTTSSKKSELPSSTQNDSARSEPDGSRVSRSDKIED
jgi:sec-independent protein translocase protein TatA